MEIYLGAEIKVHQMYYKELKRLVQRYTYIKNNDTFINLWRVDNEYFYFPRNLKVFRQYFKDFKIINELVSAPLQEKRKSFLALRDYQVVPVKNLLKNFVGMSDILFQADTGFGKTTVLAYILPKINQKTFILVDRIDLGNQMLSALVKNSDLTVSFLKDLKETDVTISTFQYLHRNLSNYTEILKTFGLLIIDEVHIIGAKTYYDIIQKCPARFRLGLSATPTRSDGLTGVITDTLPKKFIGKNPNKLVPNVYFLDYPFVMTYKSKNYANELSKFLESEKVQRAITQIFKKLKDRNVFLVINHQKTQQFYKDFLKKQGFSCEIVNATTKNRQKIFDKIGKTVNVLIGFGVMEKGVDIPQLDTVVHLSGMNKKEKLEQTIGRILRTLEGKKKPIVIDLGFSGTLEKQGLNRFTIYKNLEKQGKLKFIYKQIKE